MSEQQNPTDVQQKEDTADKPKETSAEDSQTEETPESDMEGDKHPTNPQEEESSSGETVRKKPRKDPVPGQQYASTQDDAIKPDSPGSTPPSHPGTSSPSDPSLTGHPVQSQQTESENSPRTRTDPAEVTRTGPSQSGSEDIHGETEIQHTKGPEKEKPPLSTQTGQTGSSIQPSPAEGQEEQDTSQPGQSEAKDQTTTTPLPTAQDPTNLSETGKTASQAQTSPETSATDQDSTTSTKSRSDHGQRDEDPRSNQFTSLHSSDADSNGRSSPCKFLDNASDYYLRGTYSTSLVNNPVVERSFNSRDRSHLGSSENTSGVGSLDSVEPSPSTPLERNRMQHTASAKISSQNEAGVQTGEAAHPGSHPDPNAASSSSMQSTPFHSFPQHSRRLISGLQVTSRARRRLEITEVPCNHPVPVHMEDLLTCRSGSLISQTLSPETHGLTNRGLLFSKETVEREIRDHNRAYLNIRNNNSRSEFPKIPSSETKFRPLPRPPTPPLNTGVCDANPQSSSLATSRPHRENHSGSSLELPWGARPKRTHRKRPRSRSGDSEMVHSIPESAEVSSTGSGLSQGGNPSSSADPNEDDSVSRTDSDSKPSTKKVRTGSDSSHSGPSVSRDSDATVDQPRSSSYKLFGSISSDTVQTAEGATPSGSGLSQGGNPSSSADPNEDDSANPTSEKRSGEESGGNPSRAEHADPE